MNARWNLSALLVLALALAVARAAAGARALAAHEISASCYVPMNGGRIAVILKR